MTIFWTVKVNAHSISCKRLYGHATVQVLHVIDQAETWPLCGQYFTVCFRVKNHVCLEGLILLSFKHSILCWVEFCIVSRTILEFTYNYFNYFEVKFIFYVLSECPCDTVKILLVTLCDGCYTKLFVHIFAWLYNLKHQPKIPYNMLSWRSYM